MSLTQDDIRRLADLARLELTDEELRTAEKDLDAILQYVDRLQQIDTSDVEPYAMPMRAEGWRADEAWETDDVTREFILANFPSRRDDLLSVPPVFEDPKG